MALLGLGVTVLTFTGCGDAPPPRPEVPSHPREDLAPGATVAPPAPPANPLPSPFPREEPFPLEEADTLVVVTAVGSEMAFRPAALTVRSGARVRIRLENQGTLPHNLIILRSPGDLDPVGIAALDAASSEYVPPEWVDGMMGYSHLAVPGTTVEFGFVAPEPGEYAFVCTYPGHFRSMRGILTVL